MNQEKIWLEFKTLPPQAQQLVVEFIAFLKRSYGLAQSNDEQPKPVDLADEEFIGMWRDREDMQDSVAWTRNVRVTEWTRNK